LLPYFARIFYSFGETTCQAGSMAFNLREPAWRTDGRSGIICQTSILQG